jgi:hypothetical protein
MATIAHRIQKILDHADSTTNSLEADAFLSKAQALLQQHGLSMMDLGTLEEDDPLGETRDAAVFTEIEAVFSDVAFKLAEFYGCKALRRRVYKEVNGKRVRRLSMTAYGREAARTTYSLMWGYVRRRMLEEAHTLRAAVAPAHRKSASVYMRHVAVALAHRLHRMIRDRAPAPGPVQGVNALVPVDLIDQLMPISTPMRSTKLETSDGAIAAAAGINLDAQVATTAKTALG